MKSEKPGSIRWIASVDLETSPVSKKMEDSGTRTTTPSGMQYEPKPDGSGRFDLIPPEPIKRLAVWYELGAKKYADNNWKKGQEWSLCLNSLERHLNKWKSGSKTEDHLAAVAWRAFTLMYYEIYHPEMCDIVERKKT